MNAFTIPLKLITLLIPVFMLFSISISYSQTIIIDSTFSSDAEIFPFSSVDTIFGISISGSVELLSDTSLVRIILTDNSGNEWMVYEVYPMIVTDTAFNITSACDETCFLTAFVPESIRIYIINSLVTLDQILYEVETLENADSIQNTLKVLNELSKITTMNQYISNHEWNWTAGQTGLSSLPYLDKKHLFGERYNLLGYEYYIDGIYKDIRNPEIITDNSTVVQSFDWRGKHDANT